LSQILSCVTVEMVHDMSPDWTLENEGNLVLRMVGTAKQCHNAADSNSY